MGNKSGELYDWSGLQLGKNFPSAEQKGGTQEDHSGLPELRESGEAKAAGVFCEEF